MNPFSLKDTTALVTGANTGIGQAIAIALGQAGAHVVCAGRSCCQSTVEQIGSAEALTIDFSNPMAARDLFSTQRVDILINNAGIIRRNDSVDFTEADWDDVMDVNLKAVFFTSQAFAKAVIARKATGKIVNVASLLSFQGGIRVPSYTASKHGIAGLTKVLCNEWAASGINVNAIAPGYIETNNTKALIMDAERNKAIMDRVPAGRWGQPSDIAQSAVYLSAPASDYVNGAVLNVDGGWLAR